MCGVGTGTYCRQIFMILIVTSLNVQDVISFIKKYEFSREQNVYMYMIIIQGKNGITCFVM